MTPHLDEYEGWRQMAKADQASKCCANCKWWNKNMNRFMDYPEYYCGYVSQPHDHRDDVNAWIKDWQGILITSPNFSCSEWVAKERQ